MAAQLLGCLGDGHWGSREASEPTVLSSRECSQPGGHTCSHPSWDQGWQEPDGLQTRREGGRWSRLLHPRLRVGRSQPATAGHPAQPLRRSPPHPGRLRVEGGIGGVTGLGAPPRGQRAQAHTQPAGPCVVDGAAQRLEGLRPGQAGLPLPREWRTERAGLRLQPAPPLPSAAHGSASPLDLSLGRVAACWSAWLWSLVHRPSTCALPCTPTQAYRVIPRPQAPQGGQAGGGQESTFPVVFKSCFPQTVRSWSPGKEATAMDV